MGKMAGKLPAVLSAVQAASAAASAAALHLLLRCSDESALRCVLFEALVAACLVLSAGVQLAVLLQLSALLTWTVQPARSAQSPHAEQPAACLVLSAAV